MADKTENDFPYLADRHGTNSLKWSRRANADTLPMWVADMDFRCAEPIIEALHQRVAHGVFGYAVPTEQDSSAVIQWLTSRYGWTIRGEWIVWVPGLVPALHSLCRAFAAENEQVLTLTPIYPPFMSVPVHANRTLLRCPLARKNGRYAMDMEQLAQTVTPDTRLLLLCSPHNPIGQVWTRDELQSIAAFCLQRNIVLCSDEIHCDLILDAGTRHLPTATLSPEIAGNTITLMSPAKTFNLPGLNCGFAIISDPSLRRTFKDHVHPALPDVNALGTIACEAAFTQGGRWLEQVLDYLRDNRRILYDAVNDDIPGLSMGLPEATYLAWIDTRKLNLPDPGSFFEQAGVSVINGAVFGEPGFVRLNFACSREHLLLAIERIQKAVKEAAS
jgi:cystathionine beta-lyase